MQDFSKSLINNYMVYLFSLREKKKKKTGVSLINSFRFNL